MPTTRIRSSSRFRVTHVRQVARASAFVAAFGAVSAVQASPAFPAAVQSIPEAGIHLDCVPDCTMCHDESPGMILNLGVFGRDLLFRGVAPGNTDQVVAAIVDIANNAPMQDSDGDGYPDIVELRAGANPNFAGTVPICSGLKYGCGASVAPHRSVDRLGWLSALSVGFGLGLIALRRRTRRMR